MNLDSHSNEQLEQHLRVLQQTPAAANVDRLQQTVQELQVHRIELEMQNRALREVRSELEQSVQRYADLYDHLPLAYLTVSATGQIVSANRAAVDWLRRDTRGLVGGFIGTFLDAYDAGRLAAHLEQCGRNAGPAMIELTMRPAPGETASVQISSRLAPETPAGERLIHLAITDVTKLKQTQRVLEDINREQESFNYSISHDLRAPLVTINNYAGIVLAEHAESLNEEARSMVERIRCAALRMEETLKHLLAYSTLAREDIVIESLDVGSLVADLLIEHRAVVQQSNAQIEVARPLPPVRGARTLLGQVLGNLLTNALKYTAPGEAPRVRISAQEAGEKVMLAIADRGIGIDAKYHERVFKIFERLHGYSRYPGSGVGLAIARRAVERMNGRIWVESEPGQGSCFCVELPRG